MMFFFTLTVVISFVYSDPPLYCYYQGYVDDSCSGSLDCEEEFFYVQQENCVKDVWNDYWWIFTPDGNNLLVDGYSDPRCSNRTQHSYYENMCQSLGISYSYKYTCDQEYPQYVEGEETRNEFYSGKNCDGDILWVITYIQKPNECIGWKSSGLSYTYNCTKTEFTNIWYDDFKCTQFDDTVGGGKKCEGVGYYTPTSLLFC